MAIAATMKQYIEKYVNLLFFTNFIIQVQANSPVRKAAIKPSSKPQKSFCAVALISPLKMSLAILPKIKGTTIKKEKRAARSRSMCNSTEVEIVAPERDTPGRIAIACAMPMISAFRYETFRSVIVAVNPSR